MNRHRATPISLLDGHPDAAAWKAVLLRHPLRSPLPPLGDPAWKKALGNPLLKPILAALLRRADDDLGKPFPVLTAALYREFAASGNRLRFESVYFERRRRLARAAVRLLAAGPGGRKARVPAFLAAFQAVFRETSWALPAHVKHPSGRDPRVIDLFAAETANLLAECLAVFGAVLPEALRRAVRARLRRDVFEAFLHRSDGWGWRQASNNWNAVCHQGIVGAALQVEDDAGLVAALLARAAGSLPRFLDDYPADGGCSEGPAYWDYGFGWFSLLNEQLETRTAGELSLFGNNSKIRAIAAYGPAVSLADGRLVNFSDCTDHPLRPSHLDYLARRLGLPDCAAQAEENYRLLAAGRVDLDAERADLLFWLRFFLRAPGRPPAQARPKQDAFFPQLGAWVVRDAGRKGGPVELAAKGGHNAEHHNHNDVGNFVLNVDGRPLLGEIGAPEYVRAFFGPDRYRFLAARSLGHSVPVLNGCEQEEGAERGGTIRRATTGANECVFTLDLAGAYPAAARCRSFRRTLRFLKRERRVEWTDRIVLNGPGAVESALVTPGEAEIESATRAVVTNGRRLQLDCGPGAAWDRVETHPYRDHGGRPVSIRRLVLVPAKRAATNVLRVVLTWDAA